MATFAEQWMWLIIALPLAGAVVNHFLGRRMPEPWAGRLASLASLAAFGVAATAAIPWLTGDMHEAATQTLWSWMPSVGAEFALRWDPLSIVMVLLITGVGSLVASERRWRSWEGVMLGTGLGVIGSLGGYLAVTMRRSGSRRRR